MQEAWDIALERVEQGRSAQPVVLYGLRGVGKTVLLGAFANAALGRDWLVAQIEAGAGRSLREALGESLHGPLTDLARPNAGRRLLKALKTALSFKASYDTSGSWNFGVDLGDSAGGGADSGVLETDLAKLISDVAAAAAEDGGGLALLIDEAQDLAQEELIALCAIGHLAGQREWPVLIALAGLPNLPRLLAEAKSYAERLFAYEWIERLAEPLAREAIMSPAVDEGATWQAAAVDLLVDRTQGYPYFIQQFGQETWNEALGPEISLADARVGSERAHAVLDNGFFRARWDRATKAEQQYLRAMAEDGDGGSVSNEIANRLRRPTTSLGPARASLIAKGLVFAPDHGVVQFTVPGMADFITRQHT